jgi:hypothetical protein
METSESPDVCGLSLLSFQHLGKNEFLTTSCQRSNMLNLLEVAMGFTHKWHRLIGVFAVLIATAVVFETNPVSSIVLAMQAATVAPTAAPTVVATTAPTTSGAVTAALPNLPAPVAVQVDPKMTALLVLDVTSTICQPRPSCVATLSADAALLKKARDAGAFVVYSDAPGTSTLLAQVAPQANEPKVTGPADKFFGTSLDDLLKGKGIKTVVIVGYVANGAVLYTAFGANIRGYTAVVAVDGTGAEDPFAYNLMQYQVLNEPGFANPQNQPLVEGRVTLSKSDLITFVPGAPGPVAAATASVATGMTQPATPPPSPAAATATTVAATTAATKASTTEATAADKTACLSCHGPYDKLATATADYSGWEGGEKTTPHRYVPHESKDAKDIPECTPYCHDTHPVPPTANDIAAMGEPSVRYCYGLCHHTHTLVCGTCHNPK